MKKVEKTYDPKEWETMKDEICKQSEHAKDKWGFGCLKNMTRLVWDIGTEVYFVLGKTVYKGIVCFVNSHGVCGVKHIPQLCTDTTIYLHSNKLYTNVYYALKEAEYEFELSNKDEVKE